MAVTYVGGRASRNTGSTGLSGGISSSAADGDWLFWFTYYPNAMTVAFHDPTGWTQLRKTIGTKGTVELWAREWNTGDPTSWVIDVTNYGAPDPDNPGSFLHDESFLVAFRDLTASPTILSTTAVQTTFPISVAGITNGGIGNNDVALVFATSNYGSPTPGTPSPFDASTGVSGSGPGILVGWHRLSAAGSSPSFSLPGSYSTPVPTQMMGLQVIMPDVPVGGGWGVGQIRMGSAFRGWVASTSGGAVAADSRPTLRPDGTEVGDLLILMFAVGSSETTPPTLSGWTLLSGYDLQLQNFAIYSRIADLTATDTPTINPVSTWYGGWSMTAIRGYSTVTATGHVKNPISLAMTGPVITTTVSNSLILSIGMVCNSTNVEAPTGGPVDRFRTNGGDHWALGVATEDKAATGSGNAVTWPITPVPQHALVYGLALA